MHCCRSRPRAHSLTQRGEHGSRPRQAHIEARTSSVAACTKAWKESNPEAVLAQKAVASAIRRGVLARPEGCQVRGCKYKGKPHAHHPDYRYPLAVLWACNRHHKQLHAGANLAIVPGLPAELLRVPGQQPVEA